MAHPVLITGNYLYFDSHPSRDGPLQPVVSSHRGNLEWVREDKELRMQSARPLLRSASEADSRRALSHRKQTPKSIKARCKTVMEYRVGFQVALVGIVDVQHDVPIVLVLIK
jgi:hypothetical protein